MGQKSMLVGLLLFVIFSFGGLILYDSKYGHKFEKYLGKEKTIRNWKWEDQWDGKSPLTPIKPIELQLIANNYTEALHKSGETGKPVLVFFTAEWCQWCSKMRSETMPDILVQNMLKNYILVYVDTDKDRGPARKFNIESLPSYIITNYKEDGIKAGNGFKSPESFANWLNNPNFYNQPKNENRKDDPMQPPEKKKEPQKRRLQRSASNNM